MKKYFRLFLSLVLVLTLVTGSIGVVSFAEDSPASTAPAHGGDPGAAVPSQGGKVPRYPNFTRDPIEFNQQKHPELPADARGWIDIETTDKDLVAIKIVGENNHKTHQEIENIHVNTKSTAGDSSLTAVNAIGNNDGIADVILYDLIQLEADGATPPVELEGIRAETYNGGTVNLKVNGNMEFLTPEQTYSDKKSLSATSDGHGSLTNVEINGYVPEAIIADSSFGGNTKVEYKHEDGTNGRVEVNSTRTSSFTDVTITGDINNNASMNVTYEGNAQATFNGDVIKDVDVTTAHNGTATLNANGNIKGNLEGHSSIDGKQHLNVKGTISGDVNMNSVDRADIWATIGEKPKSQGEGDGSGGNNDNANLQTTGSTQDTNEYKVLGNVNVETESIAYATVDIYGNVKGDAKSVTESMGKSFLNVYGNIDGLAEAYAADNGDASIIVDGDVSDVLAQGKNKGTCTVTINNVKNNAEISGDYKAWHKFTINGNVGNDVTMSADHKGKTVATVKGTIGGQVDITNNNESETELTVESVNAEGYCVSGNVMIDERNKGEAELKFKGAIDGDVVLNQEGYETTDGIYLRLETGHIDGKLGLTAADLSDVQADVLNGSVSAKENALSVNNHAGDIIVNIDDSVESSGGYGISVQTSGDYDWTPVGTFDEVDELPGNMTPVEPEVKYENGMVTLKHGGIIRQDNDTFTDDLLYTYDSKLITTVDIPEADPDDPDKKITNIFLSNEPNTITVVYGDEIFKDFEYAGETILSETQTVSARTRRDYGDLTEINIGKDVTVNSTTDKATGIDITANNANGRTEINIGGDLTVKADDAQAKGDVKATGINVVNYEGDIEIEIKGSMDVQGSTGSDNAAFVIDRRFHDSFEKDTGKQPVNVKAMNGASIGDYCIGDEVVAMYKAKDKDGEDIYFDSEGNVYNMKDVAEDGTTTIHVANNVTTNGDGIVFTGSGNEKTNVLIDGTLDTQGTGVILKNEEAAIGDNLTLTVWEMTADKDGDYVKREVTDEQTQEKNLVADRASEQAIQYIIKIDETQENMITTRGTTSYQGRTVAHEGDTVTLMINVPEGKYIDEVFGNKAKTKLYKNDEGQYFMVIPRGGGVFFSFTLRDTKPEDDVVPKPDPKPEPKPEPKPNIDVVPQPEPMPIEEEKPAIMVIAPLVSLTDATGTVQLNLYPSGVFSAHLRDGRNISGRFILIDDVLTLISNDNVRMPVADDGSMDFIVGEETFSFIFPADIIATLRAILK